LIESWHSVFQTVVRKLYPSCFHLVREIRKEQENTQEEIIEVEAGGRVWEQGMRMTVFCDVVQWSHKN
jgi:hypothetical protein